MASKSSVKAKAKKVQKTTATILPLKAITAKQTKSHILKTIADETELSVKQVKAVFTAAGHLAKCHLIKKGSGEFSIPEMAVKIVRKTKPATKKREGRNPLTGDTIMIAAKPKREVIRVKPLKSLKELFV